MGAAERRNKSQAMAADMLKRGIFHGRRTTSPQHANYPKTNESGSAAYRNRGGRAGTGVVPPKPMKVDSLSVLVDRARAGGIDKKARDRVGVYDLERALSRG